MKFMFKMMFSPLILMGEAIEHFVHHKHRGHARTRKQHKTLGDVLYAWVTRERN